MSVVTTKWFIQKIINFVSINIFLDYISKIIIKFCKMVHNNFKNEWTQGFIETDFRAAPIESINWRHFSGRKIENKIS